jgi:hypothetical protein
LSKKWPLFVRRLSIFIVFREPQKFRHPARKKNFWQELAAGPPSIDVSDQKKPFHFCNNVEYPQYNNQIDPTLTPYSLHREVFLIQPSTDAVATNSVKMHLE